MAEGRPIAVQPAAMARGRRKGILIAGGGLAGSLAALAMARFRPEVPLLIVEERETFGGDGYRTFADAELGQDGAELIGPLTHRPLAGLLRRLSRLQPQAARPTMAASAPATSTARWSRRSSPNIIGSAPGWSRCARTRWCSKAARRSRPKARSTRAAPPTCRRSICSTRRGWRATIASRRRTGSTGRC